ncbi:hypothetical protein EPN28_02045 [Patescibacteria group bacterium]|nr:MAG: hypothetical protein EPN28_02045 [Patescibacteria group bacterium]
MRKLKKQQAILLRRQGKSYNEIRKILDLPSKGTLSVWFKDMALSPEAKKRLARNVNLARKRGLFRFNRERTKLCQAENKRLRKEAQKVIRKLTPRELLLTCVALYWGEGYKSHNQPKLSLTNTEPELIALFMRFIREILRIPDERIRTHIHIHPNVNIQRAIKFWSQVTRLPMENFRVIMAASRASLGKRPVNSLPYGTLDVRVHARQTFFTMMGYIDSLKKESKISKIH